MAIALFVYLLALGCWLGAIVFFSFFAAPAVFGNLALPEAGKVIRALFPRYYLFGGAAGVVSLAIAVYFTIARGARLWWGGAATALALALGITLYAGAVIRPRVDAIRAVAEEANPDPARRAEFDRLHSLSVILNGAVLILDLAALAATSGALNSRG